jgi:hypothetical protein
MNEELGVLVRGKTSTLPKPKTLPGKDQVGWVPAGEACCVQGS